MKPYVVLILLLVVPGFALSCSESPQAPVTPFAAQLSTTRLLKQVLGEPDLSPTRADAPAAPQLVQVYERIDGYDLLTETLHARGMEPSTVLDALFRETRKELARWQLTTVAAGRKPDGSFAINYRGKDRQGTLDATASTTGDRTYIQLKLREEPLPSGL